MDLLDHGLDVSQEKTEESTGSDDVKILQDDADVNEDHTGLQGVPSQNPLSIDPGIQYQFRADTGQGPVTYRVVQVASQDGTEAQPQVVTTTGLPAGAQVAVVQNPFNSNSPTPDSQPDTRFTYFPAVSVGAGDVGTTHTEVTNALAGQAGITTANWPQDGNMPQGQFYVMMSPQDVLQGQRNIAPRTGFTPKIEGGRSSRDDRRRATHNEVERRRRDKINNWIVQLSKLVPDCTNEHTKGGQLGSKGGILSKACDYINELRTGNARLQESIKDSERLSLDNELLRQQCEDLKNENAILRNQMQQHGIVLPDVSGGAT